MLRLNALRVCARMHMCVFACVRMHVCMYMCVCVHVCGCRRHDSDGALDAST